LQGRAHELKEEENMILKPHARKCRSAVAESGNGKSGVELKKIIRDEKEEDYQWR